MDYAAMDNATRASESDSVPLVKDELHLAVYRRRWYILAIVSLGMMLYNGVFATWGPIAQSAKAVYGWTDGTIAILVNAGNGATMISVVYASYLIERKGLRRAMLVCTVLLSAATGLRVITTTTPYATWLIGTGQFCNGLAGSILSAIPAALSETWFPASERTTATAVGYLSAAAGSALEFIVGPNIVAQPPVNWSLRHNITGEIDHIRGQIYKLNLIEFGIGAGLLLLTAVYFPARPPAPPSLSATVSRRPFKEGMLEILRTPAVWVVVMAFALPVGVFGNWLGLIDVIVNRVGISQSEAGWLGFYAAICGLVAGIIVGRITDRFRRRMKLFITAAYAVSTGMYLWFSLMCVDALPRTKATITVSAVVGSMLINAAGPALYELSCETAYPVGEAVTGGFFTIANNVIGFIFLLITSINQIGTAWMNWCLIATMALSTGMMAAFKERYPRIDIDSGTNRGAGEANIPEVTSDSSVCSEPEATRRRINR